ncbi:site-specific integrase [uncultured Dysosmobacter sp.]|uniref:tyrosine-type recombinase/integrase n=1 Tax=uncultured Dysosmobacter sp. TaxID=2591384 RepID=UPI0026110FA9|nr:site-specific integrase [uncultured Dysosmobacter sp.]
MATIQKQGKGYKITVSQGYDYNGKRLRQYMTWIPTPGMSERQIKKELEKQAVLFEEKVLSGTTANGKMRFADFAEKYMSEYARLYLKPKTIATYTENLRRINQAIGHIRLCDLRTGHINSFYQNLQEEGIRNRITAVCKIDLQAKIGTKRGAVTAFARTAGISRSTVNQAIDGQPINSKSAEAIARTLGMKTKQVFTVTAHGEPLAPASVISYHRTLSSVLSRAVKWGYIQINPADAAEKPSLSGQEAAYLEEKDARRLLELLQSEPIRWRALITFDLLSGLRRGELLGLRWQDVDLDEHTVTIRQTSNYLPGKGVYVSTPKTATSARPLLLSTAAIMMLLEYKAWQDNQRALLGDAWEDQDGRVFTTDTGAPLFPDSVTQWFSDFIARSDMPKVTVHSLRHTYASLMIADGVPLVVVSRQLGHAQASTTANIYAHAIASAQAKAMQTFDRFNDLVGTKKQPLEGIKKAAGN